MRTHTPNFADVTGDERDGLGRVLTVTMKNGDKHVANVVYDSPANGTLTKDSVQKDRRREESALKALYKALDPHRKAWLKKKLRLTDRWRAQHMSFLAPIEKVDCGDRVDDGNDRTATRVVTVTIRASGVRHVLNIVYDHPPNHKLTKKDRDKIAFDERLREEDALFALDHDARLTHQELVGDGRDRSRRRKKSSTPDAFGLKLFYDATNARVGLNSGRFASLEAARDRGTVTQDDVDVCRNDILKDINRLAYVETRHKVAAVAAWNEATAESLANIRCMCGACGTRDPEVKSFDVVLPLDGYDIDHWLVVSEPGVAYYDKLAKEDVPMYVGTHECYKKVQVPRSEWRNVFIHHDDHENCDDRRLFHIIPETVRTNGHGEHVTVLCAKCYKAHTAVSVEHIREDLEEALMTTDKMTRKSLQRRGWLLRAQRLAFDYGLRSERGELDVGLEEILERLRDILAEEEDEDEDEDEDEGRLARLALRRLFDPRDDHADEDEDDHEAPDDGVDGGDENAPLDADDGAYGDTTNKDAPDDADEGDLGDTAVHDDTNDEGPSHTDYYDIEREQGAPEFSISAGLDLGRRVVRARCGAVVDLTDVSDLERLTVAGSVNEADSFINNVFGQLRFRTFHNTGRVGKTLRSRGEDSSHTKRHPRREDGGLYYHLPAVHSHPGLRRKKLLRRGNTRRRQELPDPSRRQRRQTDRTRTASTGPWRLAPPRRYDMEPYDGRGTSTRRRP